MQSKLLSNVTVDTSDREGSKGYFRFSIRLWVNLGWPRTSKTLRSLNSHLSLPKSDFLNLNIDIRKEIKDSRLNAIKQPILFVKGRLNFSSKTTTAAKVPLTESLLDNWLKNNHITVDKIYYLSSLFVSFFTNFSFQIYFSTAENRKTEFCGNALKLDLIELANQMGALVVRWDLWLTGWTPQPRYIGSLRV